MVPLMGARALLAAPGYRGAAVLEKEQAFLLRLEWIWKDCVRPEVCLTQLPNIVELTIDVLARDTAGLSFAHLHEIVRLAGLLAIHDQFPERTATHLFTATRLVLESHQAARNGFPIPPETPFGLAQFRRTK